MDIVARAALEEDRQATRKRLKGTFKNQGLKTKPQPCVGFFCSCIGSCSFGIFTLVLGGVLAGAASSLHTEIVEYACYDPDRSCACDDAPLCNVTFLLRQVTHAPAPHPECVCASGPSDDSEHPCARLKHRCFTLASSTPSQDLELPLMLQYELRHFYQGHYRLSRPEDEQLPLLRVRRAARSEACAAPSLSFARRPRARLPVTPLCHPECFRRGRSPPRLPFTFSLGGRGALGFTPPGPLPLAHSGHGVQRHLRAAYTRRPPNTTRRQCRLWRRTLQRSVTGSNGQ